MPSRSSMRQINAGERYDTECNKIITVAQIATVLGMIYQCGSWLHGQGNAEGVAAVLAAYEHIAAVHQRNRFDDGQAQPVVCSAIAA